MKKDLLILDVDKEYARKRIAELDDEIIALGPEFYNAFNQTSESWHDNAPFEFVRVRSRQTNTAFDRNAKFEANSARQPTKRTETETRRCWNWSGGRSVKFKYWKIITLFYRRRLDRIRRT